MSEITINGGESTFEPQTEPSAVICYGPCKVSETGEHSDGCNKGIFLSYLIFWADPLFDGSPRKSLPSFRANRFQDVSDSYLTVSRRIEKRLDVRKGNIFGNTKRARAARDEFLRVKKHREATAAVVDQMCSNPENDPDSEL